MKDDNGKDVSTNDVIKNRAREALLDSGRSNLQREFPYHRVEEVARTNTTVTVILSHPTHMPNPLKFVIRVTATEEKEK